MEVLDGIGKVLQIERVRAMNILRTDDCSCAHNFIENRFSVAKNNVYVDCELLDEKIAARGNGNLLFGHRCYFAARVFSSFLCFLVLTIVL